MTLSSPLHGDNSGPRRRGAVGVIVRCGRLLVIRRSRHVVAPGAMCFPGGAIEPGESEEQALVRELQEELAVRVEPVRRIWTSVTPWQVELSWWLTRLDEPQMPSPNPQEVHSCHWLTAHEIRAHPDTLQSNLDFLSAWEAGEFEIEAA